MGIGGKRMGERETKNVTFSVAIFYCVSVQFRIAVILRGLCKSLSNLSTVANILFHHWTVITN